MGTDELYPPARLAAAQRATAAAGLDALLLSPGSDLRYLTGYDAHAGERLTLLVLPAEGEPTLIVPTLERPAAEASPAPATGVRIVAHGDGTDPYPLVTAALGGPVGAVGLADRMWAEQVLALRAALPGVTQRLASEVLCELRIRKSPAEVAALAEAGSAIDAVHTRMGQWLR
ncbi:aminopeptidase P family N-terminal domain-containing protein, partial [Micromonospora sp. NPDC049799]|uniref:aminopeptidase P family N-terminal domain-containing protein n=1 Tax=Micromonospora sp. NPDC049799 TaxID=3154741 RepID=UPI0033D2A25F